MKYYETETPTVITTERNILNYFKESGRFTVSLPQWTDDEGTARRGKTVMYDLRALYGSKDIDTLKAVRAAFNDIAIRVDDRLNNLTSGEGE